MSLSRQQLTLIGIFAMFFGPLLLVMLMRSSWWQYQPSGMKNHGMLVQPPVNVTLQQTAGMQGKWLILYVLEDPCETQCIEHVTALRQVHRAVGRHAEHLAITLLNEAPATAELRSELAGIYPEFNLISDAEKLAVNALTAINTKLTGEAPGAAPLHTYILDPRLNVVLAYGADAKPNDLHKDLKRLLKWSDQESKN